MENQSFSGNSNGIQLDEYAKQTVRSAAVVAGIAAIVLLIRAVVTLTGFFVERARVNAIVRDEYLYESPKPASNGVLGLIFAILLFLVTALLSYFLYRFSTNAKTGIDNSDIPDVNTGLGALSYYFKLVGILFIILVAIVLPFLLVLGFFERAALLR